MDECIISVLICHGDLALSFRNEEKLVRKLTLSYDDLLGIIHEQLHLREEDVDQLLIILEH